MRPLQVDPFASCIGGKQNPNLWVKLEHFLSLEAFLSTHPAVNGHNLSSTAKQRINPTLQIMKRVLVFCKNDQLLVR